jgi:hypothetical protein
MFLPPSERMLPRPVWTRFLLRLQKVPLEQPSEDEKRDAVAVLREYGAEWADFQADPEAYAADGVLPDVGLLLYIEAERIMEEGGRC